MTFARAALFRRGSLSAHAAFVVVALIVVWAGTGGSRVAAAQAAPGTAAAATATPTPTPKPCDLTIAAKLTVSYGKTVLSGPALCRLGRLGDAQFDTASPDDVTGDADLVFTGQNIEIRYELTQRCVLTTYGVFYNDNVMVQLTWLHGYQASPEPTPHLNPVKQACDGRDRPRLQARVTPSPLPVPPGVTPTPSPTPSPTPAPTATPTPGSGYLVAAADAAQSCQTTVNGMPGGSAQCVVKRELSTAGGTRVWKGTIKLPVTELERAGVPLRFTLMVIRNVYSGIPNQFKEFAPAFKSKRLSVTIDIENSVAHQQYVGYLPNTGHSSDTPTHRRGANAYVPLQPYLLASGAFADDSNQPLATRNSAVDALSATGKNAFACRSCGSFAADDKQSFQSPFTSTATLGVNLAAIGVDGVPFTTSSASYPIDAGYKFIELARPASGSTTAFGLATFHGTTKSSGYAHDSVLSVVETVPAAASQLQVGLFHAVANRTALSTPAPGAFPSTATPLLHSTNTQGSIAYAFSPQALHLFKESQAKGTLALSEVAPLTYTTMVRYGTQYGPQSQILDVVESIQKRPPALDPFSAKNENYHFSGALGYRIVGPRYAPIDASFEQHAGEHGPYASLGYTVPVDLHDAFGAATFSLSGYGFSDGVRVRDDALLFSASYPLTPRFTLQSQDKIGHITVSQVGRSNGMVISDGLGGDAVLPNAKYNLQLSYSPGNDFKLTTGYTVLYGQGCNTKLVAKTQPCYPYRQPTPVADLAWVPFASSKQTLLNSLFIEGSIQGSSTTPFRTATDSVLRTPSFNYYDTTAGHVVRTAALGATLFSTKTSCATLLLTTANRGGDVDNFDKSAPTPGFTNTASIEFVPGRGWPAFLAAYSRVENTSGSPAPQKLFTLRAQLGVPFFNFGASPKSGCGG